MVVNIFPFAEMAESERVQDTERAIKVENVIKKYGQVQALQEIDMFVPKGAM